MPAFMYMLHISSEAGNAIFGLQRDYYYCNLIFGFGDDMNLLLASLCLNYHYEGRLQCYGLQDGMHSFILLILRKDGLQSLNFFFLVHFPFYFV